MDYASDTRTLKHNLGRSNTKRSCRAHIRRRRDPTRQDMGKMNVELLVSEHLLYQWYPTLFLAAHQHCACSLSPLSNTPDTTQLIIRVNELMSWIRCVVNELMSWIRCVWLGRQRIRAVLVCRQEQGWETLCYMILFIWVFLIV